MPERPDIVVQYDAEHHVYVLRLSGSTNAHAVDEGAKGLRRTLDATLDTRTVIKLLIDFRATVWDSEQTHVGARHLLGKQLQPFQAYRHYSAVLNTQYAGQISETEAFFTEERDALAWLSKE